MALPHPRRAEIHTKSVPLCLPLCTHFPGAAVAWVSSSSAGQLTVLSWKALKWVRTVHWLNKTKTSLCPWLKTDSLFHPKLCLATFPSTAYQVLQWIKRPTKFLQLYMYELDNSIIKMSTIWECPRFEHKCPSLSNSQGEIEVQRIDFFAKSKFKEANLHNQIRLLWWVKVWEN